MNTILKFVISVLLLEVAGANLCKNVECGSSLEQCVGNSTHARCDCMKGYYRASGSGQCEKDCVKYYCYYGGTCERGPNGRVCRCVSPYSGDRCGQERKVVVQIAVGASVMGLVLLVSLAIILRTNGKAEKRTEKKRPWQVNEDADEHQDDPILVIEERRRSGRASSEGSSEGEASEPSSVGPMKEEETQPAESCHTYVEIIEPGGSPPKYEVVAEINTTGQSSSESEIDSGQPDEQIYENTISDQAEMTHAYVNKLAEEIVGKEENQAADEQHEESSL